MELFTIENKSGLKAYMTNYGGRVVKLFVPDKTGNFDDVVLGYDDLSDYLTSNEKYYDATIGCYGNRIGKAQFLMANKTY